MVRFFDYINLRTRFIPARNITLMESREYHEPDPPSDASPSD